MEMASPTLALLLFTTASWLGVDVLGLDYCRYRVIHKLLVNRTCTPCNFKIDRLGKATGKIKYFLFQVSEPDVDPKIKGVIGYKTPNSTLIVNYYDDGCKESKWCHQDKYDAFLEDNCDNQLVNTFKIRWTEECLITHRCLVEGTCNQNTDGLTHTHQALTWINCNKAKDKKFLDKIEKKLLSATDILDSKKNWWCLTLADTVTIMKIFVGVIEVISSFTIVMKLKPV